MSAKKNETDGALRPSTVRCMQMREMLHEQNIRHFVLSYALSNVLVFSLRLLAHRPPQGIPRVGFLRVVLEGVFSPLDAAVFVGCLLILVFGLDRVMRLKFNSRLNRVKYNMLARERWWRRWWDRNLLLVVFCPFGLMVCLGVFFGFDVWLFFCGSYFLTIGPPLIVLACIQRVGPRIKCARCHYPMGSWRLAADRCHECGNLWHEPWGTIFGDRRVDRRLVWCGIALTLAGPILMWFWTPWT